jgi:sarcosine oxidase subunit gamma
MLERSSALASVIRGAGKAGVGGERTLRLGEVRGFSLVQVAGFVSTMAKVEARIAALTGLAVPENVRIPARTADGWIFRTGPEQVWIVGSAGSDLLDRAERDVRSEEGAVTSLSHSRTRIFIEGPRAADALRKGIPLDLSEASLAAGEAALTGVHHTPILLHRVARDRFEIYAMRTFALTVWDWLADAALEFGYEVVTS